VISVKGRVFQPFRHHRARELLEFHRKSGNCVSVSGIVPFSDASEKRLANEIEDAGVGGGLLDFRHGTRRRTACYDGASFDSSFLPLPPPLPRRSINTTRERA
jgi:hypothetical protein